MNFNPWHNVDIGTESPDIVQAIELGSATTFAGRKASLHS